MEYAVVIDRDPDTGAVAATSPDFENVIYVGDPAESDTDVCKKYAESLSFYFDYLRSEGMPVPPPHHRVGTVSV
jgi:hypothetical protein